MPCAQPVVEAVERQQERVAHVAQQCKPLHLRGHAVEYVAVGHEVAAASAFKLVFAHDADVVECERSKAVEEIVVVPTHIHYLSALALHHSHQYLEETRVVWLPLPHPAFFEVPSVDNVAVKYQAATVHVA